MRENADQNNSEYGHFSRSGKYPNFLKCYNHQVVYPIFLGQVKKYSPSRDIPALPKKIVKFSQVVMAITVQFENLIRNNPSHSEYVIMVDDRLLINLHILFAFSIWICIFLT